MPITIKKAKAKEKRLKLLLWGDSGVGKTPLALRFPNPIVIDLERGTDYYGEWFDFDVPETCKNSDDVFEVVKYLNSNKHKYKTLVIDPITIFWDMLQEKWSKILHKKKKGTAGDMGSYYELQGTDWKAPKAEFKSFMRLITSLDMNIILTARDKTEYAESGFLKKTGLMTIDCEKSLKFLVDTRIHLFKKSGKTWGNCSRDRSRKIKTDIDMEITYEMLSELIGEESLNKDSVPDPSELRGQIATMCVTMCGGDRIEGQKKFKELTGFNSSKEINDYGLAVELHGKVKKLLDEKMNGSDLVLPEDDTKDFEEDAKEKGI
jgi:hypothetical protein